MDLWDMVLKLVVSTVLGGIVGAEREAHERPAGLRTHILVCLGATLFTLASYEIAGKIYDPGRIAAQIVTGIGFLGAGTILRRGSVVRGLTTAASIWTMSAIGIAVAIGGTMMYVAVAASLLVVGTLTIVRQLEGVFLARSQERRLTLRIRGDHSSSARVMSMLAENGVRVIGMTTEDEPEEGLVMVNLRLRENRDADRAPLNTALAQSSDVIGYSWE